jgi:hypothetical protein
MRLRPRTAARLAWSLCGLCVLLVAAWGALVVAYYPQIAERGGLGLSHQGALIALSFPVVGALIASSRNNNVIGWIFIAIGISAAGWALNEIHGQTGLADPHWNGWTQSWIWVPAWFLMLTFLPLLFPDGRLPSPRWRPIAWLSGISIALAVLTSMLHPHPDMENPAHRNPIVDIPDTTFLWLDLILIAAMILSFLLTIAGIAALVSRFRRSRGEQRQQIKWFAYAGLATLLLSVGRSVLATNSALQALGILSIPLLPIATGVAIFKHRLYDIDFIINRTLVYGSLTGVLALVYVGGVFGVGGLFSELTSGGESNSLVVAASTLAVAALFRPARIRIQAFIDRRFYRHKYNVEQTLESFSARLRDEIDLDTLNIELRSVVSETMQPAHVSLWLKAPGGL